MSLTDIVSNMDLALWAEVAMIIFMFVFVGFAAGLVMYWVWSNTLSLIQQYFIMRRNGVETELDKLIAGLLGRKKEDA